MARKSFVGTVNPAMQFITDNSNEGTDAGQMAERPGPAPADNSFAPRHLPVETKTRRVNLMMQPSLYERVQEVAAAQRMSVNEFISYTLWEKVKKG